MSGTIKVGGHTVFSHTGPNGSGTLSVQGQNGNVLLSDDGTAVHLGNNVRLPSAGGIKDSSGNDILVESGGNVHFGDIRLPATGGIKDSSGNSILTEESGNVSIGDVRLHTNGVVRDSLGNAIITDVGGTAVVASSAGGMPPGSIMSFGMASPPSGWLVCNGSEYSTSAYSDLYSAIGTTWGSLTNGSGGAGSTHFRVPDLRGEFLRGWSNGTGNDPDVGSRSGGDNVGSSQSYAMRKIYAQWGGTRRYDGGIPYSGVTWSANWEGGFGASDRGFTNVTFDTSHSNFAMNTSDHEARPRNKNVQYCIKY